MSRHPLGEAAGRPVNILMLILIQSTTIPSKGKTMNTIQPITLMISLFSMGCGAPEKTTSPEITDMKMVVFEAGHTTEVCENNSIAEDMEQAEEAPLNIGFIWCEFSFQDTRISAFDAYPLNASVVIRNASNETDFADEEFPYEASISVDVESDFLSNEAADIKVKVAHHWDFGCDSEQTVPGLSNGDTLSCEITVDDGLTNPVSANVSMTVNEDL